MLLVIAEGLELWADCWTVDWEMDPPDDKVKPTDAVDVLIDEDILDDADSLPDPEMSSGRNSDEDDGARVPIDEPTG